MKPETKSNILFIAFITAMISTSLTIIYIAFVIAGSHAAAVPAQVPIVTPVAVPVATPVPLSSAQVHQLQNSNCGYTLIKVNSFSSSGYANEMAVYDQKFKQYKCPFWVCYDIVRNGCYEILVYTDKYGVERIASLERTEGRCISI